METNPLKQYFRQPAIYVRLPSQGKYYPPGSLVVSPNGEYPVLPMTTLDEITYRTPDALFNGTAVPNVIQSCVPNIKNAWDMPSMDIDTVLVAIRIATYGHQLDITTNCPECATEADYGVDLRTIMESMRAPDYAKSLSLGDLTIHFSPMNYKQINENSMQQFEDQKMLQVMENSEATDQQKMHQMSEMIKKITTVTTQALSQNIAMVQTPQAQVTDQAHISDWLANCDRNLFGRIRDHIIETKRQGELPPLKIQCGNCEHKYEQTFTLDMTSFFEAAS